MIVVPLPKIKVNTDSLVRAMFDMSHAARCATAAFQHVPPPVRPPYPRSVSRMTARQYRAARRDYDRRVRQQRQIVKSSGPDPWHTLCLPGWWDELQ